MSKTVDRILASVAQSQQRIARARDAVRQLTTSERHVFLAELIAEAEAEGGESEPGGQNENGPPSAPQEIPKSTASSAATHADLPLADASTATGDIPVLSEEDPVLSEEDKELVLAKTFRNPDYPFTLRAEAAVAITPTGLTTAQIASLIGQARANVASTLRQVMRTRGTIAKCGSKWFPVEEKKPAAPRKTMRDAVIDVLAEGTALGTGDIFHAVRKVLPDTQKPSLTAEVYHMRQDGLIVQKGRGARGALYGLLNGGGPQDASVPN